MCRDGTTGMLSGVKCMVKVGDIVSDLLFICDGISSLILEIVDPVSPSSDHGGCEEELGVSISLGQLVYPRPDDPKVLL